MQRVADDELEGLRADVDEIDSEVVRLLNRRARLARRIGRIKRERNLQTYASTRELTVLEKVSALNEGDFPAEGLRAVFREIITASICVETPLKVAYLGPKFTFTHEAAKRAFGASVEFEPHPSVSEVFARVERGEAHHGVVPVENSMEGIVIHTLDEFTDSPLKICGEVYLPVSQHLVSKESSLGTVRVVRSHPMALSQAGVWLTDHLPWARTEETTSTAEAVRLAALEPGTAAVGSVLAAEGYGLSVLARDIQGAQDNVTRFVVLGRTWAEPTGRDKTTLVFSVGDRAGDLRDALSAFAEEGINLTHIESRPMRRRAWTYLIFADLQGHPDQDGVRKILEKLEGLCTYFSVVGAYPETSREGRVPASRKGV